MRTRDVSLKIRSPYMEAFRIGNSLYFFRKHDCIAGKDLSRRNKSFASYSSPRAVHGSGSVWGCFVRISRAIRCVSSMFNIVLNRCFRMRITSVNIAARLCVREYVRNSSSVSLSGAGVRVSLVRGDAEREMSARVRYSVCVFVFALRGSGLSGFEGICINH